MVFRDCNSNILNDFIRFFESKNWDCVLYGDFCGKIMYPGSQRNSRIRDHCFSNYLSSLQIPEKISSHIFLEYSKFVEI